MTEIIFSSEALTFYEELRNDRYSQEKYNETNSIFHEEIKPKMQELLRQLVDVLAFEISEISFDADKDLGSPFIHGHAAKYAWGAITRLGNTKHTDLQFFVAMRFDYIRFGLYLSQKNAPWIFSEIIRAVESNPVEFQSLLDDLESKGIFLTRKIANDETGAPQKLVYKRKYVSSAIIEDTTFNVMTATPLEGLDGVDVFPQVADAFRKLIPMYRFVLGF